MVSLTRQMTELVANIYLERTSFCRSPRSTMNSLRRLRCHRRPEWSVDHCPPTACCQPTEPQGTCRHGLWPPVIHRPINNSELVYLY